MNVSGSRLPGVRGEVRGLIGEDWGVEIRIHAGACAVGMQYPVNLAGSGSGKPRFNFWVLQCHRDCCRACDSYAAVVVVVVVVVVVFVPRVLRVLPLSP